MTNDDLSKIKKQVRFLFFFAIVTSILLLIVGLFFIYEMNHKTSNLINHHSSIYLTKKGRQEFN